MTLRPALLTALLLLGAGPARAADRVVNFVNATPNTMVRLYATSADGGSPEDLLGDTILKPGQSARLNIDDGSGACVYDLRAELDSGAKLSRARVDVCKVTTYRFTG